MSPTHRDPEGRRTIEPTHERLVDRLIREAHERGDFENLPLHGKPIRVDENVYAGDRGLAFHMLRNASVAPPWIEADKEVRFLLAERDALLDRARRSSTLARTTFRRQMEQIVAAHNAAVARLNAEAPTYSQHRKLLAPGDELAALDDAFAGHEPGDAPRPSP